MAFRRAATVALCATGSLSEWTTDDVCHGETCASHALQGTEDIQVSMLQKTAAHASRAAVGSTEPPSSSEDLYGTVQVQEDPWSLNDAEARPASGAGGLYSFEVSEDYFYPGEDHSLNSLKDHEEFGGAGSSGKYSMRPVVDEEDDLGSEGNESDDYDQGAGQFSMTPEEHNGGASEGAEAQEADHGDLFSTQNSSSAGSAKIFGHPSTDIDYPKYEGFTLVLAEEFEEPIDLDADPIWTWGDGGLREGAVRFVKEQVKFKDGKMHIEVSNKRPFPKMQGCSMASKEYVPYKPLISGELRSRYNMFRYGRYEVMMKAPEVQPGKPWVNGNFIATMFVYRDANAHHWREIDFELTADRANSLTTNLLYADGTKNWRAYLQDSRKPWLGKVNLRSDFHKYAFEWTPRLVVWYFDDKVIRKGTRLRTPDKSCKVMMNTWVFGGGGFGGSQKYNNRYPMVTQYEYFRFYKWDGDKEYPCADMGPSCLTRDDHFLATNNPCDGIKQQGRLYGRRVCKAKCLDPTLSLPLDEDASSSSKRP